MAAAAPGGNEADRSLASRGSASRSKTSTGFTANPTPALISSGAGATMILRSPWRNENRLGPYSFDSAKIG